MNKLKRCKWCNEKNELYIDYHDNEWCKKSTDEKYLYEMLILESFQAGLSWECVLNKRDNFRRAYDNFNIDKVCNYDEDKIYQLLNDNGIIRNKRKIESSVVNSKIIKNLINEYGTFYNYLLTFTQGRTIYEIGKTTNSISDEISQYLKKRGMKFLGSSIIYSYLQAIGIIHSHEEECFLYEKNTIEKKGNSR